MNFTSHGTLKFQTMCENVYLDIIFFVHSHYLLILIQKSSEKPNWYQFKHYMWSSVLKSLISVSTVSRPGQVSSVQLLGHARLLSTPWTAACQASLSITNYRSLLKLTSIELMMPSNHLILCRPHLLWPSVFPSIRGLFQEVSSSHQVAKVLEFQLQHQSFHWIFRTDFL